MGPIETTKPFSAKAMEHYERYLAAAHAIQTGVAVAAMKAGGASKDVEPKHLRVGINMAMVENAALTKLLVAKGIITDDEFCAALADQAEEEKRRYEAELGVKLV